MAAAVDCLHMLCPFLFIFNPVNHLVLAHLTVLYPKCGKITVDRLIWKRQQFREFLNYSCLQLSNIFLFHDFKCENLMLFSVLYHSKLNTFRFLDCWSDKKRHLMMWTFHIFFAFDRWSVFWLIEKSTSIYWIMKIIIIKFRLIWN